MTEDQVIKVVVDKTAEGVRLDRWLTDTLDGFSRNRIQSLIASGNLLGPNKRPVDDAAKKVRAGDVYTMTVPPPAPAEPEPEDIPLDVIFEDSDLIVIDKPVGLVVHPAPGHPSGTLVNALLHHCRGSLSGIGGVTRPGIVHRLDKDTSGIMVAAKSDAAHRGLVDQFQVHSIERAYKALVYGRPVPKKGRIETNIGRDPKDRKRMANVKSGGKPAITSYSVDRAVGSVASLLDCRLFTGRTHQIRVHMSSLGHPLIGDPVYAARAARKIRDPLIQEALKAYNNQALQAYILGFSHPVTGGEMRFEVNLSNNINNLIQTLDTL